MRGIPRWLVIICVLAPLVLLAGGSWIYRSQQEHMRAEAEGPLDAVARLKVEQIARWRAVRLAEASVLMEGAAPSIFRKWLAEPTPEHAQAVMKVFRPRQKYFHHSDILLVDPDGRVLLSLSGQAGYRIHEEAADSLAAAFRERRPVLSELHSGPGDIPPHLDLLAPFFTSDDGSGAPAGAVLLRSEVREFLYPMIQDWPTSSRTAEIILLRRDGDAALVLNDLRHRPDAAFRMRLPLSSAGLPAIMALRGKEGVVQAKDYRGVEVLAAIKAVPDSPWFVVAKIDAAEIFEHGRIITLLLFGFLLVFMLALFTVAAFWWQRQNKIYYREKLLREKELQESKADWESIFQAIGHPIFILAPDQTILSVNHAWERASGQTAAEVVGRKCHAVVHGSQCPPAACPFLKMCESGCVETGEVTAEVVGSSYLVSCTPVFAENGELVKVIHVATDITKAKEMEEEKAQLEHHLIKAQKMEAIGSLAGGIAHDFNNILSPIIGYTELTIRALGPENLLVSDLRQILVAARRAKDLVRQILVFSRQGGEEQRVFLQLCSVVKEVLKLLRPSLPASIEIRANIAEGRCQVFADPTHIHQIVMNLCVNAYHAMKGYPTGVLGIGVSVVQLEGKETRAISHEMRPGSYVLLEVSDTGCGMDQATMARIFDPYFTTKDKEGGGTGLGLAVVQGMLKACGGHISVDSQPGNGSCFRLYFPEDSGPEEMDSPPVTAGVIPRGKGERILLVDDEQVIVEMTRSLLEDLGYKATGFADCEDAMRTIRTRLDDFDLLITDMAMPKISGLELISEVRELRPEMPVIISTGFSELINEEIALKHGISRYLMKPVPVRDLAMAVREALDGSQARV